jgi:hypothetical protein
VQRDGLLDLGQLEEALRPDTALVSVMAVNNEIGVVQPLAEIGALCRKHKVFFHTDAAQVRGWGVLGGVVGGCLGGNKGMWVGVRSCASLYDALIADTYRATPAMPPFDLMYSKHPCCVVSSLHTSTAPSPLLAPFTPPLHGTHLSHQAVGKVPISVNDMHIDLMSISGHKLYGPKGVGALYVRRRPRVRLEAQMSGGGQERGLRSGTLPTASCVGLGAACEVAGREMEADTRHVRALEARLRDGITSQLQGVVLNGPADVGHRYPGNVNLSFAYVEGESLLMGLKVGVRMRGDGPGGGGGGGTRCGV